MANKPITIKDSKHNFNTTRQEFMNDNNRKLGGSGKFSFRKYKTDKERVEEYLREKEQNEKLAFKNIHQKETFSAEKEKLKKSNSSVKQPIMRFKPRTDLERIYYSINSFSLGKVSKDAINEQLEKLDLFDKQKEKDENSENNFLSKYENLDEKQIEELVSQKDFLNNQGYNEKNSETVKQITLILDYHNKKNVKSDDDPSHFQNKQAWREHVNRKAAKKFLGEYNQKTHFKAASVFSFNLDECKSKAFSGSKNKINKDPFGDKSEIKRLQNKSCQENYLNFNYYDEPGHSEDEDTEYYYNFNDNNNNTSNSNSNNFKSNGRGNNYHSNTHFKKNAGNKFNRTSHDFSRLNALLLKTSKNFNQNSKENVKSIPLNNFDFNPFDNKSQEKFDYDAKSLNYLKRLSQNNTVNELNEENKNNNANNNMKNNGFLANLKKKTMNILAMKNDTNNNFLKDISINEIEDMRKCTINFF